MILARINRARRKVNRSLELYLEGQDWWWWYLDHTPQYIGPWWWRYMLSDYDDLSWRGKWERFQCRRGGHARGEYGYDPAGLEPDWVCRNCGEILG